MDVSRQLRRKAQGRTDTLDRTAVEGGALQQGHPAAALGDVSEPSQSAAGVLRGRSAGSRARQLLCAQATAVARRRQRHAGIRRNAARRAGRPLRRRRIRAAGARAAAELLRLLSGGGKLAGGSRTLRPVDPRGREPDHRQRLAVSAACDLVRDALLPFWEKVAAKRRMRDSIREFKTSVGFAARASTKAGTAAAWHKLHRDFSLRQISHVLKGFKKTLRQAE